MRACGGAQFPRNKKRAAVAGSVRRNKGIPRPAGLGKASLLAVWPWREGRRIRWRSAIKVNSLVMTFFSCLSALAYRMGMVSRPRLFAATGRAGGLRAFLIADAA